METKIEKLPENIVKVDIEIPAKDAVDYYNNAAKRLAQYVNIPGFRKGKAPRNVVEQHIGEERIKHEALESALPRIFSEVVRENNFDVVAQPYVESYSFNIGEAMTITANPAGRAITPSAITVTEKGTANTVPANTENC